MRLLHCVLFLFGFEFGGDLVAADLPAAYYFGDARDGSPVYIADQTFTRDMFFQDLILQPGVHINPNGWKIYCRGTLDLTNASSSAISLPQQNGLDASGGTAGGTVNANTRTTVGAGANGATGRPINNLGGIGFYGAVGTSQFGNNGAEGAATGVSGNGSSGSGVTALTTIVPPIYVPFAHFDHALVVGALVQTVSNVLGGSGGNQASSGSGGGSAAHAGGAGGGSGSGGGVIYIAASVVQVNSSSTAEGAISTRGGNGGVGGNALGGNAGGGSGGAGGGGGWIWIAAMQFLGNKTNFFSLTGGNGASGGNGTGTGTGGAGGGGGGGGRVTFIDLTAYTFQDAPSVLVPSTSGGSASGQLGGIGAPATITMVNFPP